MSEPVPPLSAVALYGALPCPFCGGVYILAGENSPFTYLYCESCFCTGPDTVGTIPDAVSRWNTRKAADEPKPTSS